jgi:hypothetical protein
MHYPRLHRMRMQDETMSFLQIAARDASALTQLSAESSRPNAGCVEPNVAQSREVQGLRSQRPQWLHLYICTETTPGAAIRLPMIASTTALEHIADESVRSRMIKLKYAVYLTLVLAGSLSTMCWSAEGWLILSKGGRQTLVYAKPTGFQPVVGLGNISVYSNEEKMIGILTRDSRLHASKLLLIDMSRSF